ncbi:glycosyltransferase family 4 protein [Isoptericola croceus]|uniref:glycosyltransferase family 4 protein n=1 Tax=Isoptericola croceus TaxID=3031406 RepID=UPI0023FA3801|nr:glycosyltransferase family 4 protein [Isoptericola croceus]
MTVHARPLRIAIISYYLPSTSKQGIGYQVHELATELAVRGHEVTVLSDCPPVADALYGHRHVHIAGSLRTFRFALALRKIDLSAYDVLHAWGDDYWLWRRRVPRHVRTLAGSCFEEALTIKGVKEKLRMVMLGFSEMLASLVADRTVVISPATRRWYPWVRDVIPCGADVRRFRPEPVRRADHPVVLFVGYWYGRKRGAELARQFQESVLSRCPDAELWMVVRDAPADPGPGVRVLGRLSDEDMVRVFQEAWVFCLPSDYEGFGIPYVEAMASGLPVVATPNPGAMFVTDRGRTAVVTELDGIGRELAEVLLDGERCAALAALARERVEEFTLESVVDRYESLYREWN